MCIGKLKAVLLGITAAFIVLLISSCCTKPYIVTPDITTADPTPIKDVYIASHGWHTGFIIPAVEMDSQLPSLQKQIGRASFYEFGWGDAGFYRAEKITSGLTVKAIFWPTDTVLHVVAVTGEPAAYFSNSKIVKVPVARNELESLIKFIKLSFAKDSKGNICPLGKGIYGRSQFYRAEGKYYLANTCNKWTAKGLKSMGENISVEFKLTAGSIMYYLEKSGYLDK